MTFVVLITMFLNVNLNKRLIDFDRYFEKKTGYVILNLNFAKFLCGLCKQYILAKQLLTRSSESLELIFSDFGSLYIIPW